LTGTYVPIKTPALQLLLCENLSQHINSTFYEGTRKKTVNSPPSIWTHYQQL